MYPKLLNYPILKIKKKYVNLISSIEDVFNSHDYNTGLDSLVFTKRLRQEFPDDLMKNLGYLTGKDIYYGWLFEIEEMPREIGFCFYAETENCIYVSNIPYLVLHHAPSGYAWGYNGSGPSDLGLNLAEYFIRLYFSGLSQTPVWKGQKISTLAFKSHYLVKDYINSILSEIKTYPVTFPFHQIEKNVLSIIQNVNIQNVNL